MCIGYGSLKRNVQPNALGGCVTDNPLFCVAPTGCTWNKTLIHDVASTIALEASSVGVEIGFTPVLNMFTDPRLVLVAGNQFV